jgi:hypothetical protein
MQVLHACHKRRIPKLVAVSSSLVYGPHHSNPNFIREEQSLHGLHGAPYVADQLDVEAQLDKWRIAHPDSQVTVLRLALTLQEGVLLSGWPIDVEATLKVSGKNFRSTVQNQRGALTILNDTLYVPYGGHFGDCGDYRGWVVGVSLQPPHAVRAWSSRARGGGIWAPGGLVSDGRNLYAVTGNTFGARTWGDGEAVIRLALDLSFTEKPQDFFAPSDWQELDATDSDLGATNALLLNLPGAKPAALVIAGQGRQGISPRPAESGRGRRQRAHEEGIVEPDPHGTCMVLFG